MTDPRYSRPALSTRGYVVVGVVPVLIAAVLFSLVVWNYDDSDIQGTNAPVLLSAWQPGAPGGDVAVTGVLEEDEDGCPVLTGADGSVAVAWPGGWSARVTPGGTITVYDSSGDEAVRENQEVRATGVVVDVSGSPYVGKRCAPADGQVTEVRSDVSVVGG